MEVTNVSKDKKSANASVSPGELTRIALGIVLAHLRNGNEINVSQDDFQSAIRDGELNEFNVRIDNVKQTICVRQRKEGGH